MQVLSPSLTLKMHDDIYGAQAGPDLWAKVSAWQGAGTPGTGHCAQLSILVDSILTNILLSR